MTAVSDRAETVITYRGPMDDRHAWERPGAYEEAPGVFRIPLPLPNDGLKAVNVYAITDGARVVLVDGGWALAESEDLLAQSLAGIGYGLADVREFLVTHLHRDHYTQAIAVRRTYGTPVAIGEGEKACLRVIQGLGSQALGDQDGAEHPSVKKLRVAGAAKLGELVAANPGDRAELENWSDPDRWLADGIDVELSTRTLRVVSTPGHTQGHVVFHDPVAKALFAGDHVLPHITPSIGFELVEVESPLRDYLDSLRLVRAMPDSALLPAHGPATTSTHHRIDELLVHHDERLTATAEAVERGASTGYETAGMLTWTRHLRRFAELDVFNQMMAVYETMAHLQVLAERGWLARTEVDGVAHFARA